MEQSLLDGAGLSLLFGLLAVTRPGLLVVGILIFGTFGLSAPPL